MTKAFFITVPHAGEEIPPEATWLKGLSEPHLMRDVDRFVDKLYVPAINNLQINYIFAQWHRYVIDLNRSLEDVDADSVKGSLNSSGLYTRGLHWSQTTFNEILLQVPHSEEAHKDLVDKYFKPFHQDICNLFSKFKDEGFKDVYHLDAHSMPSSGTKNHRDFGEQRSDVVVSDESSNGKFSCNKDYTDLVIRAFSNQDLAVSHNWPYKGGGITRRYGQPDKGQHTLQVELNRKLYMNEKTKKIEKDKADKLSQKIEKSIIEIYENLS